MPQRERVIGVSVLTLGIVASLTYYVNTESHGGWQTLHVTQEAKWSLSHIEYLPLQLQISTSNFRFSCDIPKVPESAPCLTFETADDPRAVSCDKETSQTSALCYTYAYEGISRTQVSQCESSSTIEPEVCYFEIIPVNTPDLNIAWDRTRVQFIVDDTQPIERPDCHLPFSLSRVSNDWWMYENSGFGTRISYPHVDSVRSAPLRLTCYRTLLDRIASGTHLKVNIRSTKMDETYNFSLMGSSEAIRWLRTEVQTQRLDIENTTSQAQAIQNRGAQAPSSTELPSPPIQNFPMQRQPRLETER